MTWYPVEICHTPTEQLEQQAYDMIYHEWGLTQQDSFYLWFLEHVARVAGGRLLDVSSGEGVFLSLARRSGFRAVGIDFSQVVLRKSQAYDAHASVAAANAQCLPFVDNCFDAVTNIGSLEHYFDPAEGVREMARVLRPGGTAAILVPNTFGLFGNIVYVWKHGEIFDDGQPLQRYACRRSWEKLLAANGLQTYQVLGFEQQAPRTMHDLLWMAQRPQKIVRWIISPLVPLNLSNMFVFFCRKG
jgi:SAM-dependent methyltransferase